MQPYPMLRSETNVVFKIFEEKKRAKSGLGFSEKSQYFFSLSLSLVDIFHYFGVCDAFCRFAYC